MPPLSLRARIVGSIALLSAIGLLAAGLAALLVERNRIVDDVVRGQHQEISEFREAAQEVDPATGEPFASPDRLIYVFMQRTIAGPNETHIGFTGDLTLTDTDAKDSLHRRMRSASRSGRIQPQPMAATTHRRTARSCMRCSRSTRATP